MSLTGYITVSQNQNSIFLNENINDLLICTQSNKQNILTGVNSNNISALKLSSNNEEEEF